MEATDIFGLILSINFMFKIFLHERNKYSNHVMNHFQNYIALKLSVYSFAFNIRSQVFEINVCIVTDLEPFMEIIEVEMKSHKTVIQQNIVFLYG